jgi:ubiquitin C-terminal hydrolase
MSYFTGASYNTAHVNCRSVTKGALARSFRKLALKMRDNCDHTIERPSELKHLLGILNCQFQGSAQHDSQELLRMLLTGLHDDLNEIVKMPKYEQIEDAKEDTDEIRSERWWNNYISRNQSIICDIFSGQLKSTVVCQVCSHSSTVFDPYLDLSLPIPKSNSTSNTLSTRLFGSNSTCTLKECFQEFLRPELLDKAEQVYCSGNSSSSIHKNRYDHFNILQTCN